MTDLPTLAEAKKHLRVDGDDDDALIQIYLDGAISHIDGPDGWLGRAVTVQTIVERFDGFCFGRLPYPPIISVTSIEQQLDTGWEAVDGSLYALDGRVIRLVPGASWPAATGPVRVTYQAGYDGEPGRDLPGAVKAAILLMVGDLYSNRETSIGGTVSAVPMSTTVEALLNPLRVYS